MSTDSSLVSTAAAAAARLSSVLAHEERGEEDALIEKRGGAAAGGGASSRIHASPLSALVLSFPRHTLLTAALTLLAAATALLLLGVAVGYALFASSASSAAQSAGASPSLSSGFIPPSLYTSTHPLLADASPFTNYSIVPPYDRRWPVSQQPDMRGLILLFFGSQNVTLLVQDLVSYFPGNEQHFYLPFQDHSDVVLLYLKWPVDVQHALFVAVRTRLHWTQLTANDSGSIYPRMRQRAESRTGSLPFPLRLSTGTEFQTPSGLRVLLYPVAFNLPQWLVNGDVDALDMHRQHWHHCYGKAWSLDYELYSGAVWTWPLLSHRLMPAYDFVLKQDLDIEWTARPPESPFLLMQRQQCVMLHSQFRRRVEDCNADADLSALQWAAQRQHVPASNGSQFFHLSNGYMYANVLGGWLGFFTSPHALSLLRHLWESPDWPGYFQHRWTDQPAWSLLLGMFYNVSDACMLNEEQSTQPCPAVCDLTAWRRVYFRHH